MAETKKLQKAKFSIGKEKGTYTGEGTSGVLSCTPEGYGEATFNSGITLRGRFKNGNFISGEATFKGDKYCGDFDNLEWLGGPHGRGTIEYANGDKLVGFIDPVTKELEITKLTRTQDYGDKLELHHEIDPATLTKKLVGTLTYKNSSTLTGEFEPRNKKAPAINPSDIKSAFGITHDVYDCTLGIAKINIVKNDELTTQISGTYSYNPAEFTTPAHIEGTLQYINNATKTQVTQKGVFAYNRTPAVDGESNFISDDFDKKLTTLPATNNYFTKLTLHRQGKIYILTPEGSFQGKKEQYDQDFISYIGTMTNTNRSIELSGIYDADLVFKRGCLSYIKDDLILNINDGILSNTKGKLGNIYHINSACGNHKTNSYHRGGFFEVEFIAQTNHVGIINNLNFTHEPKHISGKVYEKLSDGSTFRGELLDTHTKDQMLETLAKQHLKRGDTIYKGIHTRKGTNKNDLIFEYNGLFKAVSETERPTLNMNNLNLVLWSGQINSLIEKEGLLFNGQVHEPTGYTGALSNPETGDFQNGEFDINLEFKNGDFVATFSNGAKFKGFTPDLKSANGVLEREHDFQHNGHFTFDEEGYPVLKKGEVLVYFNGPSNTYCRAMFDNAGFDLFDGQKYICNFKNDFYKTGAAIVADDITSALSTFEKHYPTPNPADYKTAEELISKYRQENNSKITENSAENIEKINEKLEATDTPQKKLNDLDLNETANTTLGSDSIELAKSQIMSKLINPNKPAQQDLE